MRTVGVEEELLLYTATVSGHAAAGEELAAQPDTAVEHELKLEQAEIASAPTTDLAALEVDLRGRRAELVLAARDRGILVAALGSSPLGGAPTVTPNERYERMHAAYGEVAVDQLACGAHVHVGVASRAEGVLALDRMRPWLAVLLALSANSPYWYGVDTGYASYRSVSWGRWPTAGVSEPFGDEQGYDDRVAELVTVGAALDPGMIYFDARLSERYPTLEFRVADVGQEVDDDVVLAGLCRALVETSLAASARPGTTTPTPGVGLLRAAAWRAARHGLSGELVDLTERRLRPAGDLVDRLVDHVEPALRVARDHARVCASLDRILARGTGADLQRRDAESGGAAAVVRTAAERTAR